MPKLPRLNARTLLRALQRAGFYIHHQTGSHANLRHATKAHLHVVVPRHGGDLAPKTLKSILVQAEIAVEEFIALLRKWVSAVTTPEAIMQV
jgi:predicted RNA binding protein YcfA (HicA-like mRNA interferase family)